MKAFLLAAGLGTRLRPLTDRVPKCLVPIAGRPLLSYWLALFEQHGFNEVLLNTHHLAEAVSAFLSEYRGNVRVTLFHEPVLLGSAGTVLANRHWITDSKPFLIAYADNLTSADLGGLTAAHVTHQPMLTMGLFRAEEPTRCGIVELAAGSGDQGMVTGFEEKPACPRSNLANAGLYVTDARIFARIPSTLPADFGTDVLPTLVGDVYGLRTEPIIDVGTHASYLRAQADVARWGLAEPLSYTEDR